MDLAASCPKDNRDDHGRAGCQQTGQDGVRSAFAMLNLPTLWTAFVVNFLTIGLIWAYVAHSFPRLAAPDFGPDRLSWPRLALRWPCCGR